MDGVVGADQEIRANRFQLVGGGEHQLAYARPVVAVDAGHVVGQREGVHRDLGMCMRAEDRRTLDADCAVTQGRACRYELALMEEQANWRSASGLAG